jgi:hypothetical protein
MLEDAWDAAPEGALTLREQLRTNERAAGLVVSGGSLSSVSKNASSHSYAFGAGTITPLEIANAWRDLINLYDILFDSYTTAALDTSDEAIYAEMRRRLLTPLSEFTKDYTSLNCA